MMSFMEQISFEGIYDNNVKNKRVSKYKEDKCKLENAKKHIIDNRLNGQRIAFTGKVEEKIRIELKVLAVRHGGIISDTVNSKTDLLVVGDRPGKKLDRAKENNVIIVSGSEFLNFIKKKREYIQPIMMLKDWRYLNRRCS